MSLLKFDEYRFHFKPLHHNGLFSAEDMEKKNKVLTDILSKNINIQYHGSYLNNIKHVLKNDVYHIRIANKKKTKIEKNFKTGYFDNEPSCNIFIWNNPEEQKVFIESDKTSFNDSDIVAKILTKSFNDELRKEGLHIEIRKEIEENEFWDLVSKYEGQIRQIEFTLIYPNLPAAHRHISEDLREASKSVGSDESVVSFKATENNVLSNVKQENQYLNELNKSTSIQGTPISIKIKDLRKKIKTGKSTKSVQIGEVLITANNVDDLEKVAKILLNI